MALNTYRTALLERQRELEAALRNARRDMEAERRADPLDELVAQQERELLTGGLGRDAALLRRVRAALDRLRDGLYGECIDCGAAISPKRLGAVPWAERCLICQQQAETRSVPARVPDPAGLRLWAA